MSAKTFNVGIRYSALEGIEVVAQSAIQAAERYISLVIESRPAVYELLQETKEFCVIYEENDCVEVSNFNIDDFRIDDKVNMVEYKHIS